MRAIRGGEGLYQNNVFLCRYCSHFQTYDKALRWLRIPTTSVTHEKCAAVATVVSPQSSLGVSHKCLYSDRAESDAAAAAWGGGLGPHPSLTSTPWLPSPPLCWGHCAPPALPMCSLTSHLSSILANWMSLTHALSLLLSRVTSNH